MKGKILTEARRNGLILSAARQSLANFVLLSDPSYQMGWVHAEICDRLDRFLQDVQAHKSPRIIITMPPRSGKSEIVSRRFPAYVFGRYPDTQIIACSYGADLSQRMNRDVQRGIDSVGYARVFPDTTLAGLNAKAAQGNFIRTADLFEIVGHHGSYRSCGVGGGITGAGADILIIDDPIKDAADANSQTIRQKIWDWYTSTAYTRLSPGGGVIVMCTRWHLDDLVGRLLAASMSGEGDQWDIVNYPAIAEHDEPHRKAGEPLHPQRFDLAKLNAIHAAVGERVWQALYQQHPVPDTGAVFKADWIQTYRPADLPAVFDRTVMSWDMTFKGTNESDYVVGQVWGRSEGRFYLLDQVRGHWSFVETLDQVIALAKKWPNVTRKLIEDKANGTAIIDTLRKHVPGIVPITPTESKPARAAAVSSLWEAGNVFLPEYCPWIKTTFIPELLSFPAAAHDDQVDAMTQALADLSKGIDYSIPNDVLDYLGVSL